MKERRTQPMNRVHSISQRFDRAANTYDSHADVQMALGETLLGLYRRSHMPRRILELGCGTGLFSDKLWQRFPEAQFWITDAAPRMLAAAENRWREQNVSVSAASSLNSPRLPPHFEVLDASEVKWPVEQVGPPFDLAASNALVQWFSGEAALTRHLLSLAELMRTGGDILISGFGRDNLAELRQSLLRLGLAPRVQVGHDAETVQAAVDNAGLVLKAFSAEEKRMSYASAQALLKNLAGLGATGGAETTHPPLRRSDFLHLYEVYRRHYLTPEGGVQATWSTWAAWLIKP